MSQVYYSAAAVVSHSGQPPPQRLHAHANSSLRRPVVPAVIVNVGGRRASVTLMVPRAQVPNHGPCTYAYVHHRYHDHHVTVFD